MTSPLTTCRQRAAHAPRASHELSPCRQLQAQLHAAVLAASSGLPRSPLQRRGPAEAARRDRGQATTEYALVLLGAALVALLLVAWASSGGSAGRIGRLFDRVIDSIIQKL